MAAEPHGARQEAQCEAGEHAQYFVPSAGGKQVRGLGRLPRGIYERRGNTIRGVLMFVGRPRYRKRYDFGQATMAKASRVFEPHWVRHFYAELAKQTGP